MIGEQRSAQLAKVSEVHAEREAGEQRRALISATLEPLKGELEKLELLLGGLADWSEH